MALLRQPLTRPNWDDWRAAVLVGILMSVGDLILLKFLPPPTRVCVGFGCGSAVMLGIALTRRMGLIRGPLIMALGAIGCTVGFYGSGFLL